ncbi:MAG: hypothetical protein CMN78_02745 [Spirochaetales bacterium]|mgnify:FL=1|jgi:hypothetical protein|nr:hypothetical protein [Spirochaetales bacterium]|tara:strand:- start:1930 stop:2592 length:663 start_codon:yes stop_codon:yes gene_type:complete
MRPRETLKYEKDVIDAFRLRKVLTMPEMKSMLHCSIATVSRRLKEWGALSSYNENARYYTLASIAKFNKKGLWKHEGVLFSKHGTLKNTVVHLVQISHRGLSNQELQSILGTSTTSYMAQQKHLEGVKPEKHNRQVVYFSCDDQVYKRQKDSRFPREPTAVKLPPDAISIIILVALLKSPGALPRQLSQILRGDGHQIDADIIDNLFEHHGLKKKPNISE